MQLCKHCSNGIRKELRNQELSFSLSNTQVWYMATLTEASPSESPDRKTNTAVSAVKSPGPNIAVKDGQNLVDGLGLASSNTPTQNLDHKVMGEGGAGAVVVLVNGEGGGTPAKAKRLLPDLGRWRKKPRKMKKNDSDGSDSSTSSGAPLDSEVGEKENLSTRTR